MTPRVMNAFCSSLSAGRARSCLTVAISGFQPLRLMPLPAEDLCSFLPSTAPGRLPPICYGQPPMKSRNWKSGYLSLSPKASLKMLEQPYVYRIDTDDLFEINDEAFAFLSACDGTTRGGLMANDDEFIAYCLSEEILDVLPEPSFRPVRTARSPLPSLRFLELQVTPRCNLTCLHCYQDAPSPADLPFDAALAVVDQFEEMGGLKLLISGGSQCCIPGYLNSSIKPPGGQCAASSSPMAR